MLSCHSRASNTSGTDSSAAYPCCVELLTLSFSFSQARRLEICNIEPGDCRSNIKNRDLSASHRLGHLCFSWHVWSRCSFLRNFDLFLKLFVIHHLDKDFPGCPHFIWDISRVELEWQIRLGFAVISVRMSASVCIQRLKFNLAGDQIYPNSFFPNLVDERETSVQIRSFTIFFLARAHLLSGSARACFPRH